eukprot:11491929-Ditylum_brightwellii.AAC.1
MDSVLTQLKAGRTVLLARHTWNCFHLTFIFAVLDIFITVIIKNRDDNQVSHCSFSPPVHLKVDE